MRVISGLWRWRHNPLRRGTDLAEAWLALTALLLVALAAPLIGVFSGHAAHSSLQRSVRAQQQSRHLVTATVVRELDRLAPAADPELVGGDAGRRVLARWTAPDGTDRREPVQARLADPGPGDRFRIWTDGRGDRVARPLDADTATAHAVLAGAGAALLAAGLFEGARRLTVRRMLHRRYARWGREWGRVGPDWGRAGADS